MGKREDKSEILAYMWAKMCPIDEGASRFKVPSSTLRGWMRADDPEKYKAWQRSQQKPGRTAIRRAFPNEDLSPTARDRIRAAIEKRLDYLASDASIQGETVEFDDNGKPRRRGARDPGKESQAQATTLGILCDKFPDILRLIGEDDTAEEENALLNNAMKAVEKKKSDRTRTRRTRGGGKGS